MASCCAQSNHLEELVFMGLTGDSLNPFFEVVEAAQGLKGLTVFVGSASLDASNMPHLTRMLQHNASLTSLKVRVSPGLTLEFFVEGLKTNTTLKVLQIDLIRNWGLDENDLDLFLELLERHNFTLEELNVVVPLWKEDMTKKKAERIKFLFRLNKDHQRFDILQNDATRDTLVNALALTDDLSVIVYYLDQKLPLWI